MKRKEVITVKQVLSTKVSASQAELFQESAEAQGESKASLLRRLVEEYLQSDEKVDELVPASRPNQVAVLDKGNSVYLPNDTSQKQTRTLTSTSGLDSSLPDNSGVEHPLNPAPSSTGRQPVYHNTEAARSDNPPEQSSGIGWLIILVLFVWGLRSMPVDNTGRTRKRLAEGIGPGIYRQFY
jgi:hypothetical protein